jgi:hypothetical protein
VASARGRSRQAASPVLLLLAVTALAVAPGEVVADVAILVALGRNVAIGFVAERRARRARANDRARGRHGRGRRRGIAARLGLAPPAN